MKKILICTGIFPPDIGGPASYTAKLIPALIDKNFEVGLVTYSDEVASNDLDIDNEDYPVYRVRRSNNKLSQYWRYFWRVFKILPSYDLVYLQDSVSAGLPVWFACKLRRKKYVLKIVGDYAWEQGTARFGVTGTLDEFDHTEQVRSVRLLATVQRLVARNASVVITPSRYLERMVQSWNLSVPVEVVYNSIQFESDVSKELTKKKLGLRGTVILCIGRLITLKHYDKVVDLMPTLIEKFPNLNLVIVGDGPNRQKIESQIFSLNLGDKVKLVGQVSQEQASEYIAASDVIVSNSAQEGLPHVLVEALYYGTAVVATNVGGTPEVIQDRETGLLVSFGYSQQLMDAIAELLTNKELRQSLVVRGQEFARSAFSFSAMIDKTCAILEASI